MQLDDLHAQVKTDTGSARRILAARPMVLDPEELLEHARVKLAWDAAAQIRDGDLDA